ncbi:MAG: ABC-type enterobactin transport system, permease component [Glaciihabitans sp.]|nr:ABC-type enterobactin transport system, permease component [Glaciihabitans sp.]
MSELTLRRGVGSRFGVSLRLRRRTLLVVGAFAVGTIVLALVAMTFGEYPLTVTQILGAFAGTETDGIQRIVLEGRLPRIILAILAGAALGMSGAIFQSLTRNPLGSPDVIGFTSGAYTGALFVILVVGGNYLAVSIGALAGGLLTAVVVYALAYSRGVQGFRLIVVGIAISAILHALNSWLLITAQLESAVAASTWGAGRFNGLSWREVIPVVITLLILTPALIVIARPMRVLEMGDDAAQSLGVRAEPLRVVLVLVGVGLTAVVTAFTGPIAFVALAAPQVAHRLTRSAGVALFPAAVVGGALMLTSDVLAQRLLAPTQLPVGVVTACIGGVYLVSLLVSQARRR